MKNILIIPSWYPTTSKPNLGLYFSEQAHFLNTHGNFEVSVLYGEKRSKPLYKWFLYFVKYCIIRKIKVEKSIKNSLDEFLFLIPANRRIPDRLQLILEVLCYRLAFKNYCIKVNSIPNIIHVQSGMDAGIYAHQINKDTGIPFVIIEHQVLVFHYYSKIRSSLIVDAIKAAKKVAAVSYDERKQVLMNQPHCNPSVIWNLVNEKKFDIVLNQRRAKFTVITILNSLPIKGAVDFLKAMEILLKTDPNINFIIVGKGSDEKSILPESNLFVMQSKALRIFEYGEFLPLVERDKISDTLNQAHVFVSPSIQEPHGIAAREAMMCGLPVVSTANGGVEDSITKETGLLVPVRDPEAIADAIIKVKKNYTFYNRSKIRELAIRQCGTEAFLNSMNNFYDIS